MQYCATCWKDASVRDLLAFGAIAGTAKATATRAIVILVDIVTVNLLVPTTVAEITAPASDLFHRGDSPSGVAADDLVEQNSAANKERINSPICDGAIGRNHQKMGEMKFTES